MVMICAFTGNRDLDGDEQGAGGSAGSDASEAFADASEAFDITRSAKGAHARALTFGAGVHYCLGANLARLELQEGLAFLAEHMQRLELDGEPEFGTVSGIYGLERLPISFTV